MRSIGDRLMLAGHIPLVRSHAKPSETEAELRRRIDAVKALPIEVEIPGNPDDGWVRKSAVLAALAEEVD